MRDAAGSAAAPAARCRTCLRWGSFIAIPPSTLSFNHLIGEREQPVWNLQAKRLRHDQVNDEVELGRLPDPKIGGLCPRKICRPSRRRAGSAEVDEDHRADGGREFLFLVADIPDADYFARCVLDWIITGHVRLAEDVDFAVESLTFVDIHYRFSLRVQDGPKRPAVYAAGHIGGYADIIVTRLYEKRSRAAGLSLDLVDNREVVVHLGRAKIQPRGRLVCCLIGSLDLGRAQFGRLGLQYLHGLRDFWVRLRVPRTRHERGRCDEASSGQETNKKALAIHVSVLLSMTDGRFATPKFLQAARRPPRRRTRAVSLPDTSRASDPDRPRKRSTSLRRQAHRKDRALARLARHCHVAAHHACELARDGEPEASSAEAPRRRCIDLHKFLEQFALLFGGHPDAGVSDSEIDPVAAVSQHPARTQCHLTLPGEFAGIAEQIEQDLSQPHRVHSQCAEILLGFDDQPVFVLLGELARGVDDLVDQRSELQALRVELELPGLDLGQVEYLVDEA